ncbi:MAG: ROK family protein [Microcystaceae cyanobacterium]
MTSVIGIDLGGTAIKFGRFLEQGDCQATLTLPTPQPATPEAVKDTLILGIKQLSLEQEVIAIGLGTPGPVDVSGRVARIAINLSGWQNVPLADWLEKGTGFPVILGNDANCAGLGEAWTGAGKGYQNLILLTLGTGVGGAIILNGELFAGHQGAAGELGLITLNPDGFDCNSGNNGSLEQYCSIQGIKRLAKKDPAELGKLAQAGDATALSFWREYGQLLGTGLTSLIYVLTPEAIIIGGGISASSEYFFPSVLAEIEKRVLPSSREGLVLLRAKLGNQAGMVGAAKLAWDAS